MEPSIPAWAQTGGLLAFAIAVWLELRAQRNILAEFRDSVTALLERARMTDDTPTHGTPIGGAYRRPQTPRHGTDIVRIPMRRPRDDDEDS